jgi:amino acid adenylation domain-containing protein
MDDRKRELLEAVLRQRGVDPASLPILPRSGRRAEDPEATAPLSFAQERLWVVERLEPGRPTYNEAYAIDFTGALSTAALAAALKQAAHRHEILRTTFAFRDGRPLQVIAAAADLPLPVVDLGNLPATERVAAAGRREQEIAQRPFDLERGPLVRALLLRLAPAEHRLVLALHHILCDATSMEILVGELVALHNGASLAAPRLQYADFAVWQRERQAAAIDRLLAAWKERLAGAPTVLELPADWPRADAPRGRGASLSAPLPAALSRAVKALAVAEQATLFMILLAAFEVLVAKLTARLDFLLGSPIAGRTRPEVQEMLGFFVNTLVLRADLAGDPTFREALARTRRTVAAAYDHQDVPFGRLVEELRPERAASHTPLVQVLFLLGKPGARIDAGEGLDFSMRRIETGTSKFDLTFLTRDAGEEIVCGVEHDADLFRPPTIARLLERYRVLLEAVTADPDVRLSDLELLTPEELAEVLTAWQGPMVRRPEGACVHELIAAQALRTPDAPAVLGDDARLTYRELVAAARRLARRLRALGVGTDALVGLCLQPSPDLLVAVLGILEAGGAYVPLDPGQPVDRLAWILEDTGLEVVIVEGATESALAGGLPAGLRVLRIDAERAALAELPGGALAPVASPERSASLAYQIYTSGSTGRPKGVMVPHGGLVNLALSFAESFVLGPGERMLLLHSVTFDASVGDLFPPLVCGAALVVHRTPLSLLGRNLEIFLERWRISCLELATAFWQQWTEDLAARQQAPPEPLRTVILGGEAATLDKVRTWFRLLGGRPFRVRNHYGPTEATVCATAFEVADAEALAYARLPIGRPLPNVRIHLLGPDLRLTPPGATGEITIGGGCVARGYQASPDVTAGRFIPDPFGAPGDRLYRTGDLARWLPDGNLDFLGRVDYQVKIRGFRVEPGEIETVLAAHPGVREVAVLARADAPGPHRLAAYVVTGNPAPAAADLRAFLKAKLPAYMIPEAFVLLDRFPLNTSGKVDRKALPAPVFERVEGEPFVAPEGALRREIASVWRALLGIECIGLHDNFFDLGGHSLLLIRMEGMLRDALRRPVEVIDLFRHPTIATLADHLEEAARSPAAAPAAADTPRTAPPGRGIAIVGMAGRFPGAESVGELWRNLRDGVESITFFDDEELLAAGVPAALLSDPRYVKAKGVLRDVDRFDASFFGYSPREAEVLDPQHRHFLECSWEALESAGCDPERFPGAIGVFAGVGRNSYLVSNLLADPERLEAVGVAAAMLGNDKDFVPTRVAYKLDLKGPAMAVQTACSTSLVAVHIACRSLRDEECDLALAGGVTIPVPQTGGYLYDEGGIFSPDGHCRAFSDDARGTVPGSGVAIVVLKRLEDALADGDFIHAVIKGSAINNDGSRKVGYTAPGPEGQARVIRQALRRAGVPAESVGYVETHGTGTALGDVIEIAALKEAYGREAGRAGFCALGSLKTNTGHMDTAAGAGGLIKAALALRHKEIPPSLHFRAPHPKLGLEGSPFFVNGSLCPWTREAGPRRAAVSSFGIGGTNAHVILEEAPEREPGSASRPWQLLTISARTEEALRRSAERLAGHLESETAGAPADPDLADAAYTLHVGRRALEWRGAVAARNQADAAAALRRLARQPRLRKAVDGPGVVFLFPGAGSQHVGMGQDVYRSEPVFRAVVDRAAELLLPDLGVDIRHLLYRADGKGDPAALERAPLAVSLTFTLSYALARLWMSWGVSPCGMIGHSLGEYVAACLAGVITFEDAMALVALRGRLLDSLPEGVMLTVSLPESELSPLLGEALSLAALNAPGVSVVSGQTAAVAELQRRLQADGVESRRVRVAVAAHSHLVEPVLDTLRRFVAKIPLRPPELPYVSTLTGTWIRAAEATDPAYWSAHLRGTVRFSGAVSAVLQPARILLEVGPGRSLTTLVRQQVPPAQSDLTFASLPHPSERRSDLATLLATLGDLWCAGVRPDWAAFHAAERRRRVPLPTYPFAGSRYWIEPARGSETGTSVRRSATAVSGTTENPGTAAPVSRPAQARQPRPSLETPYAPPSSALERQVAEVWQDVLGIEAVGLHDGYFELGGDSLLAIRLLGRVRSEAEAQVSLESFLAAPTVAGLAGLVTAARRARQVARAIPRTRRDGPLPLSFVQEDTWWNLRRPGGFLQHNASAAYRGRGSLHREALERSLGEIARRHEILRTTFPEVAGRPAQVIVAEMPITVPLVDLGALPETLHEAEAGRISTQVYWEKLDVETGPLLRLIALRFGERDHGLLRAVGRLITDGGSLQLLLAELMAFYAGFLAGRLPELPEPPLQYADFAVWQREAVEGEAMHAHLSYWVERMRGAPARLWLRSDFPPPPAPTFRGARVGVPLSPQVTQALKDLARADGATLFMALLSVYGLLLHRISGEEDFVVATPISLRVPETEGVVGRFLNTLALRFNLAGDPPFRELLHRVRETCFGAYAHKDLPHERLVEAIRPPTDGSHRPLCQVSFVLQEHALPDFRLGELELHQLVVEHGGSDFELTLGFSQDAAGGLDGFLEYSADLFTAETARRMAEQAQRLAAAVVEDPLARLSALMRKIGGAAGGVDAEALLPAVAIH